MRTYVAEVDSLLDGATFGARSAALAQDAVASLGRALLDRLGRGEPVSDDEAGSAGVAGVVVAETCSGPRLQRWRPDVVDRQLARLRTGRIETLHVGYVAGPAFFDVDLHRPWLDGTAAGSLTVRVSASWPGSAELFDAWVPGFLRRAAVELDAVTGYVTLDDYDGGGSPYERWCGWGFAQGVRRAAEGLRGYYWANLLTAGHLAALGGVDAVRRAVPAAVVEPLADPGPVLVQLPGTPTTVSWADRAALHELFRPLLLEPRPGFSELPPEHRTG